MVLAFLRAELDSRRFGHLYEAALRMMRRDRALIDAADLTLPAENEARRGLLGAIRGYQRNSYLFTGFPADVIWRRVEIDRSDFPRLRYANEATWLLLSGGTRSVIDGARNVHSVPTEGAANILAVAAEVRRGKHYPDIIAIEKGNEIVVMEGHTRITAYVLVEQEPIELLIGTSASLKNWKYI
jgi:hypothetical protein